MRIMRTGRFDEQAIGAGWVEVWNDLTRRSGVLGDEAFAELGCDDKQCRGRGRIQAQQESIQEKDREGSISNGIQGCYLVYLSSSAGL